MKMCDSPTGESEMELNNEVEVENAVQLHLDPLLIPEIVYQVVKLIEAEDLRKYRLVCKLWNRELVRQMKNRSTFSFNSPQQIEEFLEDGEQFFGFKILKLKFPNSPEWKLSLFKLLSSHGELLRDVTLDFDEDSSFTMEDFKNCFRSLPELEHLKLEKLPCSLITGPIYPDTETPILHYKLKSLALKTYKHNRWSGLICKENHWTQTLDFFNQLFCLAPNLEEFHFPNSPLDRYSWSPIVECFQAILSTTPPKLTRLYVYNVIYDTWTADLAESPMNIRKLYFDGCEYFTLNFESGMGGNKIEIIPKGHHESGISSAAMKHYIQHELYKCEKGVSCMQLLRTFLSALKQESKLGNGNVAASRGVNVLRNVIALICQIPEPLFP